MISNGGRGCWQHSIGCAIEMSNVDYNLSYFAECTALTSFCLSIYSQDLAYATVGPSSVSREMVPQDFDHAVVEYSEVQQEAQEEESFTKGNEYLHVLISLVFMMHSLCAVWLSL